jgi:hypothetical protein
MGSLGAKSDSSRKTDPSQMGSLAPADRGSIGEIRRRHPDQDTTSTGEPRAIGFVRRRRFLVYPTAGHRDADSSTIAIHRHRNTSARTANAIFLNIQHISDLDSRSGLATRVVRRSHDLDDP